ncbi:hypothetical protein ABFU26_09995 [Xanthomonas campestris pv. raphani]|uniref:hypothetical protein n=1 Tax=Xanthomonas campestris TaxID=339 RepID=UPI0011D27E69|nr:hypothetical protein [Xanthomonas campestris]MEA9777034.1 hypothetical protein [Xanthomonas campestris pv. raphani]MEA9916881.1 hypothetical protein [Xanthomonas campestris pv. raphani]
MRILNFFGSRVSYTGALDDEVLGMAKKFDSLHVALFFKQGTSFDVEELCKVATGSPADSLEQQKATGVTTAVLTEDHVQIRFVSGPVRCDIHFFPEAAPGPEFPPRSIVGGKHIISLAHRVSRRSVEYLGIIQRVGVVVSSVEVFPSPAAALVALKKALPFEFGAPPASEDVVVQYNVRRISGAPEKNAVELNQLYNKSVGVAQRFEITEGAAKVERYSVLREALDINTTDVGHELSGPKLVEVINVLFNHMSSQMVID